MEGVTCHKRQHSSAGVLLTGFQLCYIHRRPTRGQRGVGVNCNWSGMVYAVNTYAESSWRTRAQCADEGYSLTVFQQTLLTFGPAQLQPIVAGFRSGHAGCNCNGVTQNAKLLKQCLDIYLRCIKHVGIALPSTTAETISSSRDIVGIFIYIPLHGAFIENWQAS